MSIYDTISKEYDEYGKIATTDWELGHKNVAKLLEPISGKKILDYGCGNGKFSVYIQEKGAEVVGIDASTVQLETAKNKNGKNIKYLLDTDSLIEIDFMNYFDVAVLNFVLCENSSQDTILAILKRIYRLLKTKGELVILNPNWDKSNGKNFLTHEMKYVPNLRSGCHVTTILKTNPPIYIPDYYWSKQNYLDMLMEAGFKSFDIFEPLASNDGIEWKDEKVSPPFLIIKTSK